MEIYKVGGAVRDSILGLKARDTDYLVVGGTTKELLNLGYQQVGVDFPVFLHPETKEEYALARTERSVGGGYCDFEFNASPEVTLEEDLLRRDFTINAIAQDNGGQLIDPYSGRRDISLRMLRHVSSAFSEDPLRVLRAARYASHLKFVIAPETEELIKEIVNNGGLAHLSPERVWRELSLGMNANSAVSYINTLRKFGALRVILPEVEDLFGVVQEPSSHPEGCAGTHTMLVFGVAVANLWSLDVRFASLLHDIGKATTPKKQLPHHPGHEETGAQMAAEICNRLRVQKRVAKTVVAATREHGVVHSFGKLDATARVEFLSRLSVWRDRNLLDSVLAVSECDNAANPNQSDYAEYPNRSEVNAAYDASCQVDASDVSKDLKGKDAANAIFSARVARVAEQMGSAAKAKN